MRRQGLQNHVDAAGNLAPAGGDGAPTLGTTSHGTTERLRTSAQSESTNATGPPFGQTRGAAHPIAPATATGLDFHQLVQSFLAQNNEVTPHDGQRGVFTQSPSTHFPPPLVPPQELPSIINFPVAPQRQEFQQIFQYLVPPRSSPDAVPVHVAPTSITIRPISNSSQEHAVAEQHQEKSVVPKMLATPQGAAVPPHVFHLWQQQQQAQQWQSSVMKGLSNPNNGTGTSANSPAFLRLFPYHLSQQQQPPRGVPIQRNPASVALSSAVSSNPGVGSLKDDKGYGTEPGKCTKESRPPPKKKRKYNHESFPRKLHRLIMEAEANGKGNIVRFTTNGLRFQILDTKGFEEILPSYFRHGKITSFKRLLHMYDFSRIQGT